MKRIRRWLTICVGLIALGAITPRLATYLSVDGPDRLQARSDLPAHRGYWLNSEQPLAFNLQAGRRKLRVLLNAALPSGTKIGDRQHYSVAYRVLDEDGAELSTKRYYVRLHVTSFGGKTRRRFAERSYLPSDSNMLYIDLAETTAAAQLELSLGPSSVGLAGIAVRPYYQEQRSVENPDRYWRRMHASKRTRIAAANALDVEFMTDEERRNAVRHRWRPLVPIGIEGDEFETMMLLDEPFDPLIADASVVSEKWFLGAGRVATFGLTQATRMLITATADDRPLTPQDLEVTWAGRLRHQRAAVPMTPNGAGLVATAELERGIVELAARQPMWLETADLDNRMPLPPHTRKVRAYSVGAEPLHIPVRHVADSATPIRLDVRTEQPVDRLIVQVDHIGPDGAEHRQRVSVSTASSNRAWRIQRGKRQPVSSVDSVYLGASRQVDELRITATGAAWISAYNRPPGLARQRRIPESLFGGDETTRQHPAWFVLAPSRADTLASTNRVAFIESTLPSRTDGGGTTNREIVRLFPLGDWRGTTVLRRNDASRAAPQTARTGTFRRLHHGHHRLDFRPSRGTRARPSALLRRTATATGHVRLECDGELLIDSDSTASFGRLALPSIDAGMRSCGVEIDPDTELYVSHLGGDGQTFREQNVQRFDRPTFHYLLPRASRNRESLTLRAYADRPGRARLRVEIGSWQRGDGVLRDWTLARVEYDLAMEPAEVVALDPSTRLGYQGFAFHPIGADVPPGKLQITVTRLDDEPSPLWLGVTRSTPRSGSGNGNGNGNEFELKRFEVSDR